MMAGGTRHYLSVTFAYWGFTLSDGALRMLVLLYFYQLGFTPFILALLFLLYEAAGIIANISGGWLATRFGIRPMLGAGLLLQIAGLLLLAALPIGWSGGASVIWVLCAQGISGIAKDLTKTASKSAIKLTSPKQSIETNNQLYRLVSWFTGSKNAMKGVGFFAGGVLLQLIGFSASLFLMAALLGLVFVFVLISLPRGLGQASASRSPQELLAKNAAVNWLSAARIFLFAARDIWFVVGLPVFLYANGWHFAEVGGFLAIWIIAYGFVQALAPHFTRISTDGLSREVPAARLWSGLLMLIPLTMGMMLAMDIGAPVMVVIFGLMLFGFIFAVNSALHSYLILAYAGDQKTAEDVGFYYAANAAGRLLGTFLSGFVYQFGGMQANLLGASILLMICFGLSAKLPLKTGTHL